ncbi:MAG TPA: zinc-binding dehydrogenase [Candidatus Elarobacter sp.]|jgi:NADPH:quinone reductase-like Zn-dependent oxidoreductase
MRAFAIARYGAPPALLELPEPRGAGVAVHVRFAGVNPIDWKILDRLTEDEKYPFVLGQDFAGRATHVEGVAAIEKEQRVFGIARGYGAYAERTLVDPNVEGAIVAPMPTGLRYEDAAALPTAGLTALAALDALGVGAETSVAIVGAHGGVGSFATQIARVRGADVIEVDRDSGDWVGKLLTEYPNGIDAVLDVANGPEAINGDLRALRPGGRIASTINALDEKPLRDAGYEPHNIGLFSSEQASAAGLALLAGMVLDKTIEVRIAETVPLENAGSVIERGRRGALKKGGKTVVAA